MVKVFVRQCDEMAVKPWVLHGEMMVKERETGMLTLFAGQLGKAVKII